MLFQKRRQIHRHNPRYSLILLAVSLFVFGVLSFFYKKIFFTYFNLNQHRVRYFSTHDNVLYVSFYDLLSPTEFRVLSQYFYLFFPDVFGNPLILSNESLNYITAHSAYDFSLSYDFPFVNMNYSGSFSILSQRPPLSIPFTSHRLVNNFFKYAKKYKIIFSIPDFLDDEISSSQTRRSTENIMPTNDVSQRSAFKKVLFTSFSVNSLNTSKAKCFGNSSLTRWCEMRDVGYINSMFVFYTKSYYKFPSPFLSISCRAPPFDIIEDRLYDEPIITHDSIFEDFTKYSNPRNQTITRITNISYVIGRFHNSMMLWHVMFDFIIPAYWTILKMEGSFDNDKNRTVFLRDSQKVVLWDFVSSLSTNPIKNIKLSPIPLFFNRVVIGLPKFERNPTENRNIEDMASFNYFFDHDVAIGLREMIMKRLNVPIPDEIDVKHPSVIYVSRDGSSRDIINNEEILSLMRKTCPFCQIKKVAFHMYPANIQIQLMAQSSVLVGLHGSGLTHTLWLPRSNRNFSSILFEILPYKYWCRNWYETAAKVSGVKYFSAMNSGRIIPIIPEDNKRKVLFCFKNPKYCPKLVCNDCLKDLKFEMELDVFNQTWMKIVDILKRNRNYV